MSSLELLAARESRGNEEEVARMPIEGEKISATEGPGPKTRIGMDSRDYAVVDIALARQQPKSTEEERRLMEKYGNIEDLEERAFKFWSIWAWWTCTPIPRVCCWSRRRTIELRIYGHVALPETA